MGATSNGLEVSGNVTWSTSPLTISETVRVLDGGILTIEPGVEVRFDSLGSAIQGHIVVEDGGELIAEGQSGQAIRFTSAEETPGPGDWAYVRIAPGGTGSLDFCEFEFGGQWLDMGSLIIQSSSVAVRNTTIANGQRNGVLLSGPGNAALLENITVTGCEDAAIYQDTVNMDPSYAGIAASENGLDGIEINGADIDQSVAWTQTAVPFFLSGWARALEGGQLSIGPGVELRMIETSSFLQSLLEAQMGGVLSIAGTAEAPVLITSGLAEPAPGDWGFVRFGVGSSGSIAYCTMEFGGFPGTSDPYTVDIESSDVTIANLTVRNSDGHGINVSSGSSPTLSNLTVMNC